MKLVVACRELRYAGKTLYEGDAFDASDKDAKVLVAVKKAKMPDDKSAARAAARQQSDLPLSPAVAQPEAPQPVAGAPEPTARPRYRRRDMTAAED